MIKKKMQKKSALEKARSSIKRVENVQSASLAVKKIKAKREKKS